MRVVPRPRFEADDALGASEPLGLVEQRGRDAAPLVVRVGRDVPDHPAEPLPLGADGARLPLELDVDQAHDLAPDVRDELDRRPVVVLLVGADVVVVRGAEERERTTSDPALLVGRAIWPHVEDRHIADSMPEPSSVLPPVEQHVTAAQRLRIGNRNLPHDDGDAERTASR